MPVDLSKALRAMLVFLIVSSLIWLHMLTIGVLLVVLKVLKQLNLPPNTPILLKKGVIDRVSRPWEILLAGHKIGTLEPLFKELV